MMQAPAYAEMSKADLIEIIETQKNRIAELTWHDEIISNTDLPIAARFAARAVRKFTQTRKPCDDGYYKGYLPAMAELAGVSASTISRGLETLSDATEALDKYTDELCDERGHVEKNVLYFRTRESFDQAAEITPTKDVPKHGGNRRLPCPECGCVHRRVKRREECAACGHAFFENERIIRGDEESLQDATTEEDEENRPIVVSAEIEVQSLNGHVNVFSLEEIDPAAKYTRSLQLATLPVDTRVLPCNETSENSNFHDVVKIQPVEICPPVASCNGLPPAELRALSIWCPWRYEPKKDKQGNILPDAKPDKVPYQVVGRAPQRASVSDSKTWSTYDQAQRAYEEAIKWNFRDTYDGIGPMCDGSFVGIDLDHCRNKETGEIAPWAQAILDRFPSYGYITPSEEGVRIVIRGEKPGDRCKKGDIEIYEEKRFFTWTSRQLPGTPATIEDGQEQLTALYYEIWPSSPPKEAPRETPVYTPACHCSDDEVLNKARGAANGPKFRRIYDEGNITDYASPSEAELALCGLLAYYSDDDEEAIDRLMRQWKLFRPEKWDRPARAGETYGQGTIRIARQVPA